MGQGSVPDLPHLIAVPATLLSQWMGELKTFFRPKGIDIFVVPSSWAAMLEFFKPGSEWDKSVTPMHRRIVFVTHSVSDTIGMSVPNATLTRTNSRQALQTIAVNLWEDRKTVSKDDVPTTTSPDVFKEGAAALMKWTILGRKWCTVWVDEGHFFRTASRGFHTIIALWQVARVVSIATATPLMTGPRVSDCWLSRRCHSD